METANSEKSGGHVSRRVYHCLINGICKQAVEHPWRLLLITIIITIPALVLVTRIHLDTNLVRLLPERSKAAGLTKKYKNSVIGGDYFTVLAGSNNKGRLQEAIQFMVEEIRTTRGIRSVNDRRPVEFLKKYGYLLIPQDYLKRISSLLDEWEAEVSPFVDNILEEEETFADRGEEEDMQILLQQYSRLTPFHQSKDGRLRGMVVRTEQTAAMLGEIRPIYSALKKIAGKASQRYKVWTGVGGSFREKLDEQDVITRDLNKAVIIAGTFIILILYLSFRSIWLIFIVILPICIGLVWAFSLVPFTVGSFNLITSFLFVVLFGMGIDYSIHLLKRFQMEISTKKPFQAIKDTFIFTGSSVLISGFTTAVALSVLIISDFKGFSEFGVICVTAVIMILAAMFTVLPAIMIIGYRRKLIRSHCGFLTRSFFPGRKLSILLTGLFLTATVATPLFLRFEYNLRKLQSRKYRTVESRTIAEQTKKVYSSLRPPGALFIASDLNGIDELIKSIKEIKKRRGQNSTLGRVRSLRDFVLDRSEINGRIRMIHSIKEQLQGKWVKRIADPDKQRLIDDFKNWRILDKSPGMEEIPQALRAPHETQDGSGRLLLSIHPAVDRLDGRNAIAFTEELDHLAVPAGVEGPIGETPVYAEIIWVVTGEGFWITLLTMAGVLGLIWLHCASMKHALWILFPLFVGVMITFGIMAITGLKLNFYNMVVIPAFFGMGVDDGVHYFRRWIEKKGDTINTQKELLEPLSITTFTTMLGYSGMVFASHPGIQSIGITACLGLFVIWITSLFLFPAMLSRFAGRILARK